MAVPKSKKAISKRVLKLNYKLFKLKHKNVKNNNVVIKHYNNNNQINFFFVE